MNLNFCPAGEDLDFLMSGRRFDRTTRFMHRTAQHSRWSGSGRESGATYLLSKKNLQTAKKYQGESYG
jgi:hypothetical protein